ncbi:hypothetical protein ACL9RF_00215 [Sphingobacterium sp. Mn56C]|uniref:hypothetical protein n=1 Tax=Sphingobacterium sp. Mn56C TaxID=3395261 RepID=UPI003BE4DD03
MRQFIDPFVVFYASSWLLIRYTRKMGCPIPWLNNWLTDFVFVPLILHFMLIVALTIAGNRFRFRFPLVQIMVVCLYVAIGFEYIAPKYTSYNTADWGDVLAYFLGGIAFYYIHQPYTLRLHRKKNLKIDKTIS